MKRKAKAPRPKHVPQRTCVTCRTVNAKRGMVRIVRLPTGTVAIDLTGKRSGRGAYLCRNQQCWTAALQKKSLEYALKTTLNLDDKAALQAYIETLPVEETDPGGAAAPAEPETGPPGAPVEA
ncbi:MAG TPA: YlxR family protein [Chloroflexia bacterium]|nr:YlxR family protein [Chloroflexia bacterium]